MSLYNCERLGDNHNVSHFDCGEPSLNSWLVTHARRSDSQSITRTFVWNDRDVVTAYFALTPGVIERSEPPSSLGRGGPKQTPVVVIAKLALDKKLQGRGEGATLLVEAIRMAVIGMNLVGGRLIVVDALDESKVGFYERHDFKRFPGQTRLGLKGSEAAKAVDLPWP